MRNLVRCLLSAAVLTLPIVGQAQPAAAQGVDLTCAIAGTLNFNPGLTLIPHAQTLTGVVRGGTAVSPATPCTSLTGTTYKGASGTISGTGNLACVGGTASGTVDLTWDNGDTSRIAWTLTAVPPVPVFTATVVAGALKGATLLVAGAPTGLTGICLLFPLTSLSGAGVVVLLGP